MRGESRPAVATAGGRQRRRGGRLTVIGRANTIERALRSPHIGGEVAQLVEHMTENHGVDSSILSLATSFFFL